MDFDDHHNHHHHHEEEEEAEAEEEEEHLDAASVAAAKMQGGGGAAIDAAPVSAAARRPRYRECLKNHAVGLGAHAVDGCGEFLPAGPEGSLDALKCAACNCHRNFHRKEVSEATAASSAIVSFSPHHHQQHHQQSHHHQFFPHHQQQHQQSFSPYYRTPAGYLQVTPTSQRPLALPSTSGGGGGGSHSRGEEMEDMSNPSSFGGGNISGSSKKRYRTKFTPDQKDKMLGFAESVGWRIQRQDDEAVDKFCNDTGIKRQVLKVWMHNNKHTLGKKP